MATAKITDEEINFPKGTIQILGEGKSKHVRRFINCLSWEVKNLSSFLTMISYPTSTLFLNN